MSKEQKITQAIEHLKNSIEDINQQLFLLHEHGVDFVFHVKTPFDTKSGTRIELAKATKLVDYLKNE